MVHFNTSKRPHIWACLKCKKYTPKPHPYLTDDEVEALIGFAGAASTDFVKSGEEKILIRKGTAPSEKSFKEIRKQIELKTCASTVQPKKGLDMTTTQQKAMVLLCKALLQVLNSFGIDAGDADTATTAAATRGRGKGKAAAVAETEGDDLDLGGEASDDDPLEGLEDPADDDLLADSGDEDPLGEEVDPLEEPEDPPPKKTAAKTPAKKKVDLALVRAQAVKFEAAKGKGAFAKLLAKANCKDLKKLDPKHYEAIYKASGGK